MVNDVEESIKEIEENLSEKNKDSKNFDTNNSLYSKSKLLLSKFNQKILDSNGFLTKEGGYLCKEEWHATAIPAGMVSASFMLPKPLGLLTFLSYLFMNKRGFDLLKSDYEGHWNDVMEEYAYAASSLAITIALWTYNTEQNIAGANEINQILLRLFVGA